MSRIAPPAEKIMAVASIYVSLIEELPPVSTFDPHVQAALIDSATRLAMSTDTRDMGLLARRRASPLRQDNLDGTTAVTVTDRDGVEARRTEYTVGDLAAGDHFAHPEDAVDPTGGHLGDLDP